MKDGNTAKRDLPERTLAFAVRVVRLCASVDRNSGPAQVLARQLVRSGTSIGANVEEGQGSQTKADFVAKYSIACKEARETLYWLRLLIHCEIISESRVGDLIQECSELVAILTAILKKAKPRKTQ